MSSDKLIMAMESLRAEINLLVADEVGYAKVLELNQKLNELLADCNSVAV